MGAIPHQGRLWSANCFTVCRE